MISWVLDLPDYVTNGTDPSGMNVTLAIEPRFRD